ncbi:hypothetical protein DY000_02035846 [Brassica cretica]|uniref:Uncharacterized protein n=1 Tax=Brassica cretica TaxID=69181 RepID=A0ABQ7DN38_BRACR|nr:hypothetical protein DY000_02035846 [Brassica cretica]
MDDDVVPLPPLPVANKDEKSRLDPTAVREAIAMILAQSKLRSKDEATKVLVEQVLVEHDSPAGDGSKPKNPKVFLFKMDFVVAYDRDFWGWQSPAGMSPEQPQIATMKEKPSHHPKREIRAQQICFGGTEERSTKYESDPRTVNFISVLPLIQKEPGNGRDIIGNISMPDFQIIYPIVKSTYVAFTTILEMKLLWLSKWCPIGVKLVSMDRGHIGLHYDRRDRKVNEFRSCFVRAVKVHSAFPQVSSEPEAKPIMGVSAGDSTLGVVFAATQRSRPVVPRRGGR